MTRRRVAITGMGVIAPNGRDLEAFWRSVADGRSAVRRVSRFSTEGTPCHVAAEIDDFDAKLYTNARSAKRLDKCHLYALAAARLAESDAGLPSSCVNPERIGVALGTSLGGMGATLGSYHGHFVRGYHGAGLEGLLNGHNGAGAGEIACQLNLRGHACVVGSGSASGNDAIGYALSLLRAGEADIMLAGGAEAPLIPFVWASLSLSRVMTRSTDPPGRCMKPFDRHHDGMVLGEGAAFVVMEELSQAVRRRAKIYCEVLGHGRSSEAYHSLAPDPDGTGPRKAIERAIEQAGIKVADIDYINAHGTATAANDVAESRAIQSVFGDRGVAVSSTKPVTGHLLGAAGALETVITALAIANQTVPFTLNFQEAAPGCSLDYVPSRSRHTRVRNALNLSCGFGGLNSSLVLGEYAAAGK